MGSNSSSPLPPRGGRGRAVAVALAVAVLAVAAHFVFEWLFLATMPSFLSALPRSRQVLLLGVAAPIAAVALAAAALAALLAAPLRRFAPGGPVALALIVPAGVLGVTALLLLDNFANTVLGFGLRSLGRAGQPSAVTLALLLGATLWWWLRRRVTAVARRRGPTIAVLAAALAVLVAGGAGAYALGGEQRTIVPRRYGSGPLPNVLLLGGDGIEAAHTSLYGYRRPTTPALEALAADSLVCRNAFANAASTSASLTSLLSGQLPTRTGVVYPPDIANHRTATQHLPGMLRQLGYRTAQFSIRWYGDALDLNLRDSFDEANFRSLPPQAPDSWVRRLGHDGAYFLELLRERVAVRLFAAEPRPDRVDPLQEVVASGRGDSGDAERLRGLRTFLRTGGRPFFAHLHLMGTHGTRFAPTQTVFSAGRTQDEDWMVDFYDDAVLDFDRALAAIVADLTELGLLERTLLIVYSDHGMHHETRSRVPLVLRFPGGGRTGAVLTPTQNLDIAPTVLELLGVERPEWMSGHSLLREDPPSCRPLFSTVPDFGSVKGRGGWFFAVPKPPFFTLGEVRAHIGRRSFKLDLPSGWLTSQRVEMEQPPRCRVQPEQVRTMLIDELVAGGYDVSSLEARRRARRERGRQRQDERASVPRD